MSIFMPFSFCAIYCTLSDLNVEQWKKLNLRTRYYTSKLHVGAFYLPAFLEEMLREVEG